MRAGKVFRSLTVLALAAVAVGAVPRFQKGTFVQIEQKKRSRVLYYQVNTPVEKEDTYYEIGVSTNGTTYVGDYSPRHEDDTPPEAWKVGDATEVRLEKHYMYLKQPGGDEMKLEIKKRFPTPPSTPSH
jgi:hypothetical protein